MNLYATVAQQRADDAAALILWLTFVAGFLVLAVFLADVAIPWAARRFGWYADDTDPDDRGALDALGRLHDHLDAPVARHGAAAGPVPSPAGPAAPTSSTVDAVGSGSPLRSPTRSRADDTAGRRTWSTFGQRHT